MLSIADYARHDGLGLAELVRRREVTPLELLETAIAAAGKVNPQINAIVTPMHDIARARAAEPLAGPFAGVPFLAKDIFQEYAGVPASYGNRALKDARFAPQEHAEMIVRWLRAGVVVFGRTNVPEFGAKAITEAQAWGACRNPWNLAHTPGGSSGGAAAAVASGIVPIAGANDGGGSIRIPAAHCGLFGFKPGRGRTPMGPRYVERMHGAVIDHVLTRSVRDSAAMLDATHGPELGALFHIAPPERPYSDELSRDPGRLTIAYSTRSPIGTPVDAEAIQAVTQAARLLETLGHHVEEANPDIDGMQLGKDFITMWFATCAATFDDIKRRTGCGNDAFEIDTRAMAAFGRATRANAYVEGYMRWNDYARRLGEFHQRYDLYLTPTLAMPPARVGEIRTPDWQQAVLRVLLALHLEGLVLKTDIVEQMVEENLKWVPFTQLANLTGTPAMSVPLHWARCRAANAKRPAAAPDRGAMDGSGEARDDGGYLLPLGVQLSATPGGEGLLFRVAAQLEQAQPWAQRRPPLHVASV
ncbi:amidase [Solimonas soli]|uniref:amidase n=1 Tax=Solimonas soli TaxID=413479 RepID=UPI0004AF7108|nr:amidase family protein [Solimonas soli]